MWGEKKQALLCNEIIINFFLRYGYPDETYLDRVEDELAVKGVTEKDIWNIQNIHKTFLYQDDSLWYLLLILRNYLSQICYCFIFVYTLAIASYTP